METWDSPLALASNFKALPPSTSPNVIEGEGPLSKLKDNIDTIPSKPKVGESPPSPASNGEALPPSTPRPVVEDPILGPKENIAPTPSLEPQLGESPLSPASNSKAPPPFGRSVKDNVDPPHHHYHHPHQGKIASSDSTTNDDTCPYMSIHGKLVQVRVQSREVSKGRTGSVRA